MRRLLQFARLLAFLWRARSRRVDEGNVLAWHNGHAEELKAFLERPVGKALMGRLRSEVLTANERAALSDGSASLCGVAQGMRMAYRALEFLAEVTPAVEQEQEAPAGSLEHLRP